jgi:hypothetical protein
MGKKSNHGKAFQYQTTKLRCAVAALAAGALYLASHLGRGLSGVAPHVLEQGPDGCYPLPAQLASRAPVAGSYDVFLVRRAVVNGLCAVDPARPLCASVHAALAADDVTTTVRGFYGIRASCHAPGSEGYHFPQYCDPAFPLNSTAFGMLAAQGPARDACEHKHRWPAALCARLDTLRTVWPSAELYATNGLSNGATAAAADSAARAGAWGAAWARHGSCTGLHPELYFDAAMAAHAALLAHDKLDAKTLGPSWPALGAPGGGPFEKPFTLKQLGARFGGAYAAVFHCDKGVSDGRTYLTEVQQCVRQGAVAGQFQPTTCPRWVLDGDKSCRPAEGVGKGGVGGAQVWLGLQTGLPPSRQ